MSRPIVKVRSELISVQECAQRMECSETLVYRLVGSGRWIGSIKTGSSYVIPRVAFDRWLRGEYIEQMPAHDPEITPANPFLVRIERKAS